MNKNKNNFKLNIICRLKKTYYKIFTPCKFFYGISILWRGNSIYEINNYIISNFKSFFTRRIKKKERVFLFNSARSAIAFSLKSLGIKKDEEVIISSFTCDAVTYGVRIIGANPVYVDVNNDLTMNFEDIKRKLNKKTKAIIIQNTFGRLGLNLENIKYLSSQKIYTLIDDSLSYGSRVDKNLLSNYGDLSLWTFEASKTLTLGWGGLLKVNNSLIEKKFQISYRNLKRISILEDLRKLIQLWTGLYFQKNPLFFGPLIWYLLYLIGIIKNSNIQNKKSIRSIKKIGYLGESMYFYFQDKIENIYKKTHQNYKEFEILFEALNIKLILKENENENIVSPRFPALIKEKEMNNFFELARKENIEIGRWFSSFPDLHLSKTNLKEFKNTNNMNESIVNFPCYWTLKNHEKEKIKSFILKSKKLNFFINQ